MTTRALVVLLAASALAACGGQGTPGVSSGAGDGSDAAPAGAGFAFVTSDLGNTVSSFVLDPDTGRARLLTTVATGLGPRSAALYPDGRFLYVANYFKATLSAFSVSATGMLAPIGTYDTGSGPTGLALHPGGGSLYVVNSGSSSISRFAVDGSGALTPGSTTTLGTGAAPQSMVVHPGGGSAYVSLSGKGQVAQFSVDGAGNLAAMATPLVDSGKEPWSMAFDPTGAFLYVTAAGDNVVVEFGVGAPGGALRRLRNPSPGTLARPVAVALHPGGKFAYVAGEKGAGISWYGVGTNGMLTWIANVGAGNGPSAVGVDPSGAFLWVTNQGDGTVSQFTLDAQGRPTPNVPAIAPTRGSPMTMTLASRGRIKATPAFAYVAQSYGVRQYAISDAGKLRPLSPGGLPAGDTPYGIATDPSGRRVYVANLHDGTVSQYAAGEDGLLAPLDPPKVASGATTRSQPTGIALDPTGRFAYVANNAEGTVSQFSVGLDGRLSPLVPATLTAGTAPVAVAVEPTGRFAYVANFGKKGEGDAWILSSVAQFAIDADGKLSPIGTAPVSIGARPSAIAISPLGTVAWVTVQGENRVQRFTIGTNGALGPVDTSPTGPEPASIAVHPSGRFLHVTNSREKDVSQYVVGASGALTPIWPLTMHAGACPVGVTYEASGTYAYVVDQAANGGAISQYEVDPVLGSLIPLDPPMVGANQGPQAMVTTSTWK